MQSVRHLPRPVAFARRRSRRIPVEKASRSGSREDPTKEGKGEWTWALGLTLLAWIHRIAFLHSNATDRGWAYTLFYRGDAKHFFLWSDAMLAGESYDSGIPFHPPGFAAILTVIRWFFGAGPDAYFSIKVTLAAIASLAIGLLYLLVRTYLGHRIALLAALLSTYNFGLYVIAVATVSEGLYTTLLLGVLLVWSRFMDHPLATYPQRPRSTKELAWAGFALGIGSGMLALIRAEAGLTTALLVGIGLLGVWQSRRAAALVPWMLVALGWLVVVAPWTVRNAHNLAAFNKRFADQLAEPLPTFVPITLYGPLNLALANQNDADGTFSPDVLMKRTGSDQLQPLDPLHLEYLLHGDRLAFGWIRDHPGSFLRLVSKRWRLLTEVSKLGFGQWNWPGGLRGVRRPVDMFVPDRGSLSWVMLPLGLVGCAISLITGGTHRRWALLVMVLSSATFAVTAFFFGYVRQGAILLPLWLSLVAVATMSILDVIGRNLPARTNRLRSTFAKGWFPALVLILLLLEVRGARGNRRYERIQDPRDMLAGVQINGDATLRIEVEQNPR